MTSEVVPPAQSATTFIPLSRTAVMSTQRSSSRVYHSTTRGA